MRALQFFFPAKTACERREQIHEIFDNLRGQVPLLYASAIVNLVGMHLAIGDVEGLIFSPFIVLLALLVWRAIYWSFFQKPTEDPVKAQVELLKVVAFTIIFSLGFAVWAQVLMTSHPALILHIAFFNLVAAVGAAYGLGSFPRAAAFPLAILGLPVAIRLLIGNDNLERAMGISLLFALLLFMRLISRHSHTLAGLISSRMAAAREHNRAISAEVAALKRADEDGLTGLPNRAMLIREIERSMVQGPSNGGGSVVAICDLDGFKRANDVFGHAAGDALLVTFGKRLRQAFGTQAIIARMGGDEFALFWRRGLARDEINKVGAQICRIAAEPVDWDGKQLTVGTSCGFTEAGPYATSVGEFLRQADTALYMAKASGRGRWQFYDDAAFSLDMRRAKLEVLLLSQEAYSEFDVEFQPIFCLQSDQIVYVEALARWKNPELGDVRPSEFIFLAESLGRIEAINDCIFEKALIAFRDWRDDVRLSFNLSATQVSRPGAADHLLSMLAQHGIPAHRLLFEVTESAVLADLAIAQRELETLREAGCLVALDDFGAGHACVSYLRDLVFDVVKLDGSLTRNIQQCARSRQILLGLVNLCHAADSLCVAEHVETAEQLLLIKAMGCDFAQGFHLARPMAAKALDALRAEEAVLSLS